MTTRDQLSTSYWQTARPYINTFFGGIVSAYLFGKKSKDCHKLSLLHDLQFYLDIMEQDREVDVTNGITNDVSHYIAKYHIDRIKKQLRCTGVEGKVINALIGFYTQASTSGTGIGFMTIQGTTNPFIIS